MPQGGTTLCRLWHAGRSLGHADAADAANHATGPRFHGKISQLEQLLNSC